jgi:molybdopterin/thiamine biosynthesis adenylyltransferase
LTPFSNDELERYDRQMRISGWGQEGQTRLRSSTAVVAGVGGLGCPASTYLVASGVGTVRVIDAEKVELSNLNRQTLHWTSDVGSYKVESAFKKLGDLNPNVKIEAIQDRITEDNVVDLVRGSNVVIDAMDNYATRFMLNKACVREKIPFIHGAVHGLEGQMTTIIPYSTPCLSCVFPEPPREVRPFPVLGTTPATIATLQVTEALKILTGIGKPLGGRLLIFDGTDLCFQEINIERNPKCAVCGESNR